jgi:RHS repeat-associated protein
MLRHLSFRRVTSLIIIVALLTISIPPAIARSTAHATLTTTSNLAQLIVSGLGSLISYTQRGGQGRGMPALSQTVPARIKPRRPLDKAEREAKVVRLEVNTQENSELHVGERAIFTAIPVDENGSAIHGLVAEWESDDTEVISIEKNGEALAVKAGTATLTATAGNKRVSVKINVVADSSNIARVGKAGRNQTTLKQLVEKSQLASKASRSHSGKLIASMLPQSQLPTTEYDSIYRSYNIVGEVPGKTTPGASIPPAAVSGTEAPGSSNFNFNIPVVDLPGRGLDASLSLVYNSRVWNKSTTSGGATRMTYNFEKSWFAPGFNLNFGQLRIESSIRTLIDPDGTRHQLLNNPVDSTNWETTDGTFIRFNNYLATYPDGTQVSFGDPGLITGVPGSIYQPVKITDRNGNYILITHLTGSYGQSSGPRRISTIQDSMGRYVRFYYDADKSLVAITVPGYQNGADRQVVRFYYQNVTINQAGLFQSSVLVNAQATARLLRYVYMPGTQAGYRFDYSVYGMVYQIAQLRGMSVSTMALDQFGTVTSEGQQAALTTYNYPTGLSNLTDVPTYTARTDDWAGRTSAQPTFYFNVDQALGVSTVTAPDGTVTESHTIVNPGQWDDGLISETIVKQGATVLSDTAITWQQGANGANPRIQKTQITNEAGQTKAVVYSYDPSTSYNNVSAVSERDFAPAGTLGTELRRTETTYLTSSQYLDRGLINLPTSLKIFKGGTNTPIAQVDYSYDETGLTARPDIIMYTDPATTARGNLTTTTTYADAAVPSTAIPNTQSYDVAGNLLSASVDCCQQKSYGYTNSYQYAYPTSETRGNAGQLTISTTYDYNTGLLLSATDENSRTSTIQYDANSLRHSITYRPDGSYVWDQYGDGLYADPDAAHMHSYVFTRTYTGFGSDLETWQFFDGRGDEARAFISSPNGYSTRDSQYDVMGRVYRTSNPYYASGSAAAINPTGLWTTKAFDNLGRVTSMTMPSGDSQSPTTSSIQISYAGTITTATDQAGKQRRQIVDALDRIIRMDEPDANSSLGASNAPVQPTYYDYDALDNLIHITQGAQHRYFKYDSLSRLTYERQVEQDAPYSFSDPLTGNSAWSRKYIYDSHSLLTDIYDARQIHTQISYDGLNRPAQITYSDGTPTVTYTFDQARTGYYNASRLTSVMTSVSGVQQTTQEYDYDQMGRVVSQRQKVGSTTYTIGYSYAATGQIVSESYPSGRQIVYSYDTGARLSRIGDGSGATYDNSFAYVAHGGLSSETFGNGAVRAITYNNRLQPRQIKLSVGGSEQQSYDYFYGQIQSDGSVDTTKNNGQIGRIDGYIAGVKQWDQRFTYDSVGRLSQAAEYQQGQTGLLTYQAHYDYDRYGNRYQYQQNVNVPYVSVPTTAIDQSRNRFNSQTTYDAEGNITLDQKFRGMQYQYDANGRMKWSANADGSNPQSSVYDGIGQRVQTTVNGTARNIIYDIFGQSICEYSQGALQKENIYRGGELLASNDSGGWKYVMTDHQGSTRVVMSGSSIVARHDYLPFGEEVGAGTGLRTSTQGYATGNPILSKYAGTERDSNGLDHTWWRKLESTSGRWTSPDPYKGSMSIGDPQSFNRYSYVENDPVNLVDPTGLYLAIVCTTVFNYAEHNRDGTYPSSEICQIVWVPERPATTSYRPKRPRPESQSGQDELVHCDPKVKAALDTIFNLSRSSGGRKGTEYGFRVDRDGKGNYVVSQIFTSQSGQHVTIEGVMPGTTVAIFHTHPDYDPIPSGQDVPNANATGTLSYVRTFSGGLNLYNPTQPKDSSGKDRIIKAPKCPKVQKPKKST